MQRPCLSIGFLHISSDYQSDKSISLNVDLEEHCAVGGDSRPARVWWRGLRIEIRAAGLTFKKVKHA